MEIVNRTGGQVRLSILGKNLTSHEVDIYQINIVTGDPLTFSADPLSSGNYDMITVKGRNGSIMGQVQGDEQDPSGEVSFSFYEDFSFVGKKYLYRNSKNMLMNILNGEGFYNGKNVVVPIGTNGTDKTTTAKAKFNEMNKPYRFVYYNEGEFIKENGTADAKTGKVALRKNPYKSSFDTFNKTFCFEVMTTSSAGQVNRMFPILAKSTSEWAEGDINQFNCTAQRGCDMWEKDDFFTEVYPVSHTEAEEYMKNFNELYVDFIVTAGGSEFLSTGATSNNDKLLLDLSTSTPSIKKSNGTAWEVQSTLNGLITKGTRFKSKRVEDGTGIDCNVFAVVGEDGTTCVDFSTNGSSRYFCKVKDFDLKISSEFKDYITE